MSPATRIAVIFVAFAALIVGFIVASPDDESSDEPAVTTSVATTTTPDAGTTTPVATSTAHAKPVTPTEPEPERVVVRELEPVDGIKKIEVKKGETVRFTVSSDVAETAHLHGYDIEKAVAPGKPARFVFEAKFDGIYELELENAGVPVAELRVEP